MMNRADYVFVAFAVILHIGTTFGRLSIHEAIGFNVPIVAAMDLARRSKF